MAWYFPKVAILAMFFSFAPIPLFAETIPEAHDSNGPARERNGLSELSAEGRFAAETGAGKENGSVLVKVEIKSTKDGDVFTRDASHPKLGEAWRDPSGRIWGDLAKNEDGSTRLMTQDDAEDYCRSLDAELPSLGDYLALRRYFGASDSKLYHNGFLSGRGYTPQVLPNLTNTSKDKAATSRLFWSSSDRPAFPHINFYYFSGDSGEIYHAPHDTTRLAVRCVTHADRLSTPRSRSH